VPIVGEKSLYYTHLSLRRDLSAIRHQGLSKQTPEPAGTGPKMPQSSHSGGDIGFPLRLAAPVTNSFLVGLVSLSVEENSLALCYSSHVFDSALTGKTLSALVFAER